MKLTLGHSPDPDDAFMFYALAKGLINTGEYEFEHILQDIQTLNERALKEELDITAVSIHAYAYLSDKYALLSSGASMGDNYGPMLVGKRDYTREELKTIPIAVPGTMTSAFLALQLYLGQRGDAFQFIVVPFDQIFETIQSGRAAVGLIIHEGQLTYQREGLVLIEDLGKWWFQETNGLPLPLGGNVIRRALGQAHISKISNLLKQSILYSLEHRSAAVAHSLPLGRGLNTKEADHFIGMYVNELTVDYGERGRAAVHELFTRAKKLNLIPEQNMLDWILFN